MSIDWKALKSVFDQATKVVLTSHIRPDCDALGSELGMAGLLEQMGKEVRIVNGQETPPNLTFIDPKKRIMCIGKDVQPEELMDADLWIILDTSAWAQLGPMGDVIRAFTGKKIIFDHHVGEDDLGATPFKETTAEATGRLVVDAVHAFELELTAEMAPPLFAAIATDTGWFRFPSVKSITYKVGGQLIDAGASPAGIYAELYEQQTLGRLRLQGIVLNRIRTEIEGRLAHTYILKEDFIETGAVISDTEDLVNHCLEIQGTEFAVIMIEQPTGGFKISFRSRCDVECNVVAGKFGGGGHKAAAGAFAKGPFEEISNQVLAHVRTALK